MMSGMFLSLCCECMPILRIEKQLLDGADINILTLTGQRKMHELNDPLGSICLYQHFQTNFPFDT
jgi:hypothetical protein